MNVSAIVSAYYASKYLKRRLDNLMYQDPRLEIIVVAQKGSHEEAIAKTYDYTWIITPNIPTIYAAWNMAIKAANCEFITNANCDDYIYSGSYAEMAKILTDNPDIALVYGDNNVWNGIENKYHARKEGDFEFLKTCCFVGPMPMWRKSLHDQYGYFNDKYRVTGDYEFWLRIASMGEKFYHLKRAVGLYEKRADSAEHRDPYVANTEREYLQRLWKNAELIP